MKNYKIKKLICMILFIIIYNMSFETATCFISFYSGEDILGSFFAMIVWIIPYYIILFIIIKDLTYQLNNSFIYYAYRIENRSKWLLKQVLKITVFIMIIVSIKLSSYMIINTYEIEYLMFIKGLLFITVYIISIVLLGFLLYQYKRDDTMINIVLLGYVICNVIAILIVDVQGLIFMQDISIINFVVLMGLCVMLYGLNVYKLNRFED